MSTKGLINLETAGIPGVYFSRAGRYDSDHKQTLANPAAVDFLKTLVSSLRQQGFKKQLQISAGYATYGHSDGKGGEHKHPGGGVFDIGYSNLNTKERDLVDRELGKLLGTDGYLREGRGTANDHAHLRQYGWKSGKLGATVAAPNQGPAFQLQQNPLPALPQVPNVQPDPRLMNASLADLNSSAILQDNGYTAGAINQANQYNQSVAQTLNKTAKQASTEARAAISQNLSPKQTEGNNSAFGAVDQLLATWQKEDEQKGFLQSSAAGLAGGLNNARLDKGWLGNTIDDVKQGLQTTKDFYTSPEGIKDLMVGSGNPLQPSQTTKALVGGVLGGTGALVENTLNFLPDTGADRVLYGNGIDKLKRIAQQQNPEFFDAGGRLNVLPELPQDIKDATHQIPAASFIGEQVPYAFPVVKAAGLMKEAPLLNKFAAEAGIDATTATLGTPGNLQERLTSGVINAAPGLILGGGFYGLHRGFKPKEHLSGFDTPATPSQPNVYGLLPGGTEPPRLSGTPEPLLLTGESSNITVGENPGVFRNTKTDLFADNTRLGEAGTSGVMLDGLGETRTTRDTPALYNQPSEPGGYKPSDVTHNGLEMEVTVPKNREKTVVKRMVDARGLTEGEYSYSVTPEPDGKVRIKFTEERPSYTPEIQTRLDELRAEYDANRSVVRNRSDWTIDPGKELKGLGMKYAADRRGVIQGDSFDPVVGGLTERELLKLREQRSGFYAGKPVVTPDGQGVVISNPYGKVRVELEGGLGTRSYERSLVEPSLPAERKLVGLPDQFQERQAPTGAAPDATSVPTGGTGTTGQPKTAPVGAEFVDLKKQVDEGKYGKYSPITAEEIAQYKKNESPLYAKNIDIIEKAIEKGQYVEGKAYYGGRTSAPETVKFTPAAFARDSAGELVVKAVNDKAHYAAYKLPSFESELKLTREKGNTMYDKKMVGRPKSMHTETFRKSRRVIDRMEALYPNDRAIQRVVKNFKAAADTKDVSKLNAVVRDLETLERQGKLDALLKEVEAEGLGRC